jgi:hypothetical protein
MEKKIYITCPDCGNPIDFSETLGDVHQTNGDVVLTDLNVYYLTCDICQKKSVKLTVEKLESSSSSEEPEEPERLVN